MERDGNQFSMKCEKRSPLKWILALPHKREFHSFNREREGESNEVF